MSSNTQTDKLQTIYSYLDRGWSLIEVHYITPNDTCSCGKADCASPGKHPVRGAWQLPENHITTRERAERVWAESPLNVGIVTGKPSGIFVIDVDVDGKPGLASFEKLVNTTGQDLRRTLIHITGSGGYHHFLKMPEFDVTNSNKALRADYPGIDLRGTGGFVVAPPSESGKGPYDVYWDDYGIDTASEPLKALLRPQNNFEAHRKASDTQKINHVYLDLPKEVRDLCDAYTTRAIQNEFARFEKGSDDYENGGWDDLTNEIAHTCLILANSPWNSLQMGEISKGFGNDYYISETGMVAELFDNGFKGGDKRWTDERKAKCIHSAFTAVINEGKTRDMPKDAQAKLEALKAQETNLFGSKVDWETAFNFDPSTIKWLPGGFAREGDYLTMIGDGKVGKSVFCHDWAWRMATGQEFLGESMENPTPVLYLDRENPLQIFIDHFRSYGATPQTMGLLDFRTFPEFRGLDTPEGGKAFVDMIKESNAKIVFIDTISRFVEGPENDNDTWLNVYRNSIVPLRAYDQTITVVRIDHFGKDKAKGGRGGSSKEQDVDSVYEMKKTQGGGFVLERTHTRSGLGPETVEFTRTGRALNNQWAPGETSHVLKPRWTVGKNPANVVDKTSVDAMVDFLDSKCIPDGENGWGVRKVRDLLRENDFKGSTAKLDEAQTRRKNREDYDLICPYGCELR